MIEKKEQLCVLCQKSGGGCKWSDHLEPVDGWTAEENLQGFFITKCPEFVKETPDTILPKDFNNDGMMLLLEALVRQMREDYINGRGPYDHINRGHKKQENKKTYAEIRAENRKLIEKWLIYGQGKDLLNLADPKEVVKNLRKLARMHDNELARFLR